MGEAIQQVEQAIKSKRIRFANEDELQRGVAICLEPFAPVIREHRFDENSRIDFLLPELRIGVECKVAGSPTETLAQLLRYADREEVDGLILVTSRIQLSRSMPMLARGKPLICIPLWSNCF